MKIDACGNATGKRRLAKRRRPDAIPAAICGEAHAVAACPEVQRSTRSLLGKLQRAFLASIHLAAFALVYWLAFAFQSDFALSSRQLQIFWSTLPWFVAVQLGVFYLSGYYHAWWCHVTFSDLIALLRSALVALLAVTSLNFFLARPPIPRSVLVLDCALVILALGILRCSWRVFREYLRPLLDPKLGRLTLLVGTDHVTGVLAHQIQSQAGLPYRIVGLLATHGAAHERQLGQFPILGHVRDIRHIAADHGVTDVLATAGVLSGKQLRSLMNACRHAHLALKLIPALEDRLDGDAKIPVRSLEINDLLRREPIELDTHAIGRTLQGCTILVTGAGGSIGSEICRQVLRFNPKRLVLVGRGENRVFEIERQLRAMNRTTALCARIADVTDRQRMRGIFEELQPEVVFHAAAHKHVPLMEANPGEAIKNNVLGTRCVADLADEFGAKRFVLISTDKAVRPTNVMGATKHVAEQYVLALSSQSATRFCAVRFGNVLGSAGSVVPVFQEQIRHGGPITVTDPRMTRYFMTIPEASQLVLQAATMSRGGEIFVLDMGEPVRIVDLARDMIRLSGLREDSIEITFTGIRPGEKLHEVLYSDDESSLPTSHPKLRAANHRPCVFSDLKQSIGELARAVHQSPDAVRRKLQSAVPDYQPSQLPENRCEARQLAV